MLAIIGGSGLTQLANLEVSRRQVVRTPYGEPSGPLTFGAIRGVPVVFVARHGDGHTIPPHQVNYRANLWALKEQGAGEIVAVVSVGGIRADLGPGKIVVPHQIIDHTWGRTSTFFENEAPVKHSTSPSRTPANCAAGFSPRQKGLRRGRRRRRGLCRDPGPETGDGRGNRPAGARRRRHRRHDRHARAALAREIELAYAAIAVVVNHAAGRVQAYAACRCKRSNTC